MLAIDEIVDRFDLDKVQKGGARFDRERLEWLNGQWIRRLDDDDLVDRLLPFLEAARADGRIDRVPDADELRSLLPIIRERIPTLGVDRRHRRASCGATSSRSTRRRSCPSAGTPRRRADGARRRARGPRRARRR